MASPRRIRDPKLLDNIRKQPCFICGAPPPSDPAHLVTKNILGDIPSNLLPLCRDHHLEQHRIGIRTFANTYRLPIDTKAIYPLLQFEWKF